MYKIAEIFKSIQGEGPYTGYPAIFIRMANCNLACSFCDTDFNEKKEMHIDEIIHEVVTLAGGLRGLVVITGGEPFLQDLGILIEALRALEFKIQIETNGTIAPDHFNPYWKMVDIVVSPKTQPVKEIFWTKAEAVKFVIKRTEFPNTNGWRCPIYIQPMDEKDPIKNKKNQEWAVKLCLEHGYRLSLQIHKLLDIQ